jgi:GT2 family glycosyltransferase
VDVVVPFRGQPADLEALRARLARLKLKQGDTIVVVENGPGQPQPDSSGNGQVRVLSAPERPAPGYARNVGAACGRAEWLVFIDGDTEPAPDLLDRYFEEPPSEATAQLAGGVIDEPVAPDAPGPARYAYLRGALDQRRALELVPGPFVQTANVACRRSAFEAVGGFREDIWPAEDADLSFRLQAAGWKIERRDGASVVHFSRRTARAMLGQAARHGAGCAWLNREYPGSSPPRRLPGLVWWGMRFAGAGLLRAALTRDRDEALRAVYEPLWELAFELGRSRSIERLSR